MAELVVNFISEGGIISKKDFIATLEMNIPEHAKVEYSYHSDGFKQCAFILHIEEQKSEEDSDI